MSNFVKSNDSGLYGAYVFNMTILRNIQNEGYIRHVADIIDNNGATLPPFGSFTSLIFQKIYFIRTLLKYIITT